MVTDAGVVEERAQVSVPAVQAAALAATGFVAGAATVAVVSRHRTKRAAKKRKRRPVRRDHVVELVPDRRPPAAPRLTRPELADGSSSARSWGRAGRSGSARRSLDGLTRRRGERARAAAARRRRAGRRWPSPAVFAARAADEAAAREGIARMRFAVGDRRRPADFHERFRDDPLIGRAVRARPWLRVRRNPDPWETLDVGDHRAADRHRPRARAIQRRMIAALGPRAAGCATRRRRRRSRAARRRSSRPAACSQARAGDAPRRARGRRAAAASTVRRRLPRAAARDPRDRDVDGRDARPARARARSTSSPPATSAISSSSGG